MDSVGENRSDQQRHTRREFVVKTTKLATALTVGDVIAGSASGAARAAVRRSSLAKTYSLRFANAGGPTSNLGRSLQKWAQLAEQRSNGQLSITSYVSGELGAEGQVFQEITSGSVDGSVTASSYLTALVPQVSIWDLPFLVPNLTIAKRLMLSPIGQKLLRMSEPKGLKCLAWNMSGVTGVLARSSTPLTTPSQYRGIKVRAIPNPLSVNFWELLGTTPVPMGTSDVYLSLSQGLIDAADVSIDYAAAQKWYEPAKSWAGLHQRYAAGVFYMNLAKFNDLPTSLRQILVTAAQDAAKWSYGLLYGLDLQGLDTFSKNGLAVAEQFNRQPFESLALPIHAQYRRIVGAGVMNEVLAEVKALQAPKKKKK